MPKVHTYKTQARRGGKPPFKCVVCGQDIDPGEERYEWEFRSGGPRRQHTSHGYPKRSQLTQSKMAEIYSTIEAIEEHGGWGDTKEYVEANLQSVEEAAQEVHLEYEEASENFGGGGPSREKADELESFISELSSAQSDVSNVEKEEGEDDERFMDRVRDIAVEAVSSCP